MHPPAPRVTWCSKKALGWATVRPAETRLRSAEVRDSLNDDWPQLPSDGTMWRSGDGAGTRCMFAATSTDPEGFILALTDPNGYAASYPNGDIQLGDIDGNGQVSVGDIGAFVALLAG